MVALAIVVVFLGAYWFFRSGQPVPVSDQINQSDQYSSSLAPIPPAVVAESAANTPPASAPVQAASEKPFTSATFRTNKGDIEIVFNPKTPNTVANFIKLAKSGFYDGTKFHRVIKGFMSQGGDPFSKDDSKVEMWGRGGPGYTFADEITTGNSNEPYTVAMANAGLNTNGSQFFINAAPNHNLDSKHTVFARVSKGEDIAKAINEVSTGQSDRPVAPVVISSISLR